MPAVPLFLIGFHYPQLVQLTSEEMQTIDSIHKKPRMHRSLVEYHAPEGTVFGWTYEQLGWPFEVGGFVKA